MAATSEHSTIRYATIRYDTIRYDTIQCHNHAIRDHAIRYHTMIYHTILSNGMYHTIPCLAMGVATADATIPYHAMGVLPSRNHTLLRLALASF